MVVFNYAFYLFFMLENLEYADARRITNLNLGLIVSGSVLAFLIILLTIDLCCYFTNKCGILMNIRNSCKKTKSSSSKPYVKFVGYFLSFFKYFV